MRIVKKLQIVFSILTLANSSFAQTSKQVLSGTGIYFPKGTYNKYAENLYPHILDNIGSELNFDTLKETKAENKNFHSDISKIELDTIEQTTYCVNRIKKELELFITEDKNSRIERTYLNKKIQRIVTIRLGKLYETREYKYSSDGELDTLFVTSDNKVEIYKSNSGSIIAYPVDTSIVVYKTGNLVTMIADKLNNRTFKIYYKDNKVERIVTFTSDNRQQIGEMIFDKNELLIIMTNENIKELNVYAFDSKDRWTTRDRFINGKLFSTTTRKYTGN